MKFIDFYIYLFFSVSGKHFQFINIPCVASQSHTPASHYNAKRITYTRVH